MLKNYLKLAFKILGRRKVFTAVSLFGISFTLLVLMVAMALLDHAFAPRSPEGNLRRALGVYSINLSGPNAETSGFPGYGFIERYVRDLPGAEEIGVFQIQRPAVSYAGSERIESYLKRTDGGYWRILDFDFLEGGPITAEDFERGSAVAVINESTRRRFFGGEEAVGRRIAMDGQSFRVVGVVRDVPFLRFVAFADVWTPITTARSGEYRHELLGDFVALVLAPERSDLPALKDALAARMASAESPDPREYDRVAAEADTLFEYAARQVFDVPEGDSPAGLLRALLVGLGLLFMLLPALNLVNLNLSRILERASEIGVRKSFGASSWPLVGQFLVENLVLTLIGGLIGLALAALVLGMINDSGIIPYARFALNPRVFLGGLAAAIVFGILSGVYPAWRMSRMDPVAALRGRNQ
jgi:putative ABC transport system permease protein